MLKFLTSLILRIIPFAAFATAPLFAECAFSLGAEWIYFSPNSESVYYAILSTPNGAGSFDEVESNKLDQFYSGYRVFGSFGFCSDYTFYGRWSHLNATHMSSITATGASSITNLFGVPATLTPFSFAEAKTEFTYSAFEALFECPLLTCSCFDLFGAAGIQYVHLCTDNHFSFGGATPLSQKLQSHFWGIGPELGLEGVGSLGCGFSLFGNLMGAFLIGQPKEKLLSNASGTPFSLKPRKESWRVVPYADIRLGASYLFCFRLPCCENAMRLQLDAGYEALVYWQALRELSPSNSSNPLATGELYTFDRNTTMHGPFIALSFFY